ITLSKSTQSRLPDPWDGAPRRATSPGDREWSRPYLTRPKLFPAKVLVRPTRRRYEPHEDRHDPAARSVHGERIRGVRPDRRRGLLPACPSDQGAPGELRFVPRPVRGELDPGVRGGTQGPP